MRHVFKWWSDWFRRRTATEACWAISFLHVMTDEPVAAGIFVVAAALWREREAG